ncbi:hypothetical protein [Streptococcus pneumoniae]|nr:hypothetical protein [Streptococcus pneumoniae]
MDRTDEVSPKHCFDVADRTTYYGKAKLTWFEHGKATLTWFELDFRRV